MSQAITCPACGRPLAVPNPAECRCGQALAREAQQVPLSPAPEPPPLEGVPEVTSVRWRGRHLQWVTLVADSATRLEAGLRALAAMPAAKQLEGLEVMKTDAEPAAHPLDWTPLLSIIAAAHRRLETLAINVVEDRFDADPEGRAELGVLWPALRGLRHLDVNLTEGGTGELISPALEALTLGALAEPSLGWLARADCPALTALELWLGGAAVAPQGLARLDRKRLPRLARLGLHQAPLGLDGLEALIGSPIFPAIEALDLRDTELGPAVLTRLSELPRTALRTLTLDAREEDEELAALFRARQPWLTVAWEE